MVRPHGRDHVHRGKRQAGRQQYFFSELFRLQLGQNAQVAAVTVVASRAAAHTSADVCLRKQSSPRSGAESKLEQDLGESTTSAEREPGSARSIDEQFESSLQRTAQLSPSQPGYPLARDVASGRPSNSTATGHSHNRKRR